MGSLLDRADDLLAACEKGLVVVLFSLLVIMILFNILSRNLFQRSFQEILEIAPATVLWLSLLGAGLALKDRRHIRLELLMRFCPGPVRKAAEGVTALFGMAVMGTLFLASLGFVADEIAIFGSRGWTSTIFPFFFALSAFRYGIQLVNGAGGEPAEGAGEADGHRKAGASNP